MTTPTAIDCNCCLMPFEDGNTAAILPCGHYLHSGCVEGIIRASQDPFCDESLIDPNLTGHVAEAARASLLDARTKVACPIDRKLFDEYVILSELPSTAQNPDFPIDQYQGNANFRTVAPELDIANELNNVRYGISSPTSIQLSFYAIFVAIVGILWVIVNGLCEVIRSDADIF